MNAVTRVYAGRLAGMVVRSPDAEPIGRVRDVVVMMHGHEHDSRVLGLIVALPSKRRIFLPMLRVATIEPQEIVLASGQVSMRSYQPREGETTISQDIIGAKVHVDDPELENIHGKAVEVADVELTRTRSRDWVISKIAVSANKSTFGRRPTLYVTPWKYVHGLGETATSQEQETAKLRSQFEEMRPADVAPLFYNLSADQRRAVTSGMNDEQLADILQELSEERQAELIEELAIERAADVLEEMDPDDAADLLEELPDATADVLLELMDPEDSAPVRRLMSFQPDTVGALMTSDPLVMTPQRTVAEALAMARNPDLPTSLSSMVFVVRPPTATPTGTYLGCLHLQKLLREPPSELIGGLLDPDLPPLYADDMQETAARYFATYNLVCGPVLDDDGHLLGAVAVDDLLDHMLPEDWRETGIRPAQPATTTPAQEA
ncbi:Magnesium transporter MgtE [Corynebacterium ciconiae DSM 44920]|uniref:magnesium transporter MgtE N-terminal domain-containing protein n=1 Tax=Corynebacterium ciconiae TaxID=227319 RepID=UPI00047689BD|nr:CBS domain-containing protein [Corynebacterium ciconiae]WKD60879.1 Magnesium transporter MgtE [Corynebacterium ciconiae DSM 44920]